MNEKEKNVTNENKYAFIEMKRVDVKELKSKQGEAFYMVSGLYEYKERTALIEMFFKDKALYDELLAIPPLHLFKLYYDVVIDSNNNLKLSPNGCSL